ncbi:MAG: acyl-CoA dehydrogenase family protein [Spongiibacteraceae bacterium]
MDYALNDDERMLVDALEQLAEKYGQAPSQHVGPWYDGTPLRQELIANGFLRIAREEGFGPLQAALVVDVIARQTAVAEVAASALIVPQLFAEDIEGPIALIDASDGCWDKPVRFLSVARHALIDLGDDVVLLPLQPADVEVIDAFVAYPTGRLTRGDLGGGRRLGADAVEILRQWWRVALAVEMSATMLAALDKTVAYLKERHAFGRPIGSFQSVQHRLAVCAQQAHSARWLALRAADTRDPADAAIALAYAQEAGNTLYWDTHQFTGAIGLTFEYPLHYWTLRLRVMQSDFGGALATAATAAEMVCGL